MPVRKRAGTRLRDFMEIPPITVSGETTIDEAAALMWEKNVGSVIVVDESNTMIGIVTERDVIFSVSKLDDWEGNSCFQYNVEDIHQGHPKRRYCDGG